MRRTLALSMVFAVPLVALACGESTPQPQTPPPTTAAPTSSTSPAATSSSSVAETSGVDKDAIDRSVAPCDDFYQFACGSWIKKTEIPADESRWMRSFSVIRERNEVILRGILESYAKGEGATEPYAKTLGDFYGACMDEEGIEKANLAPLAPTMKAIDAIHDARSLTKFLGKSTELGLPLVFDLSSAQDFSDASQVVGMIWQSGLGMPEREYYLDTSPKMTELRTKYEEHVAAMLKLAGEPEAKAKASAKAVLKIETALATAWMTKEDRREPKKIVHRATRAELDKLVPGFAWDTWLDAANAKGVQTFNVAQPDFMKAVAKMIGGGVSLADWKTYLRWQAFHAAAPGLPARFVDENFKWNKTLLGTQSLPARWKRCVRTIDSAMGEALAQPFVKKTLGSEGKQTVVGMVQAIEAAMHGNLEKLAWMDDTTRTAAFAKLSKIANKIAYPDKWRSYEGLTISRTSYLENMNRSAAFEYRRQIAKIGKPVDRTEWQMSPPTVNAYYDPQLNEMVFPAGILQPPFYANTASMPSNYGGIGMVMGHELTHGFDDEGRQFDASGNLRDWWSAKVNEEFEHRADCVKRQFDEDVVLGDVHVNGKLTLGENIADLGGVKLAYAAMESKKDAPKASSEFSPEQQFFLGFAQGWCGKLRDETLRVQVATNPHAPQHLRVNNPLSNLPEFAQAFSCKPGSKMVRKDRCEVW